MEFDESSTSNTAVELEAIKDENEKLHRDMKQIESKFESEKLITSTRMNCLNGKIQLQAQEIRALKQQLNYQKKTTDLLRKKITDMKEGRIPIDFEVCSSEVLCVFKIVYSNELF